MNVGEPCPQPFPTGGYTYRNIFVVILVLLIKEGSCIDGMEQCDALTT
jgi:hypothetical protein